MNECECALNSHCQCSECNRRPQFHNLKFEVCTLHCVLNFFLFLFFFHSIFSKWKECHKGNIKKKWASTQEHQLNGKFICERCQKVHNTTQHTFIEMKDLRCAFRWNDNVCLSIFLSFANDDQRLQVRMTCSKGDEDGEGRWKPTKFNEE